MTTMQGTIHQSWPGWLGRWLAFFQAWVALPPLLVLILLIDLTGYFAGLLYWYGNVMAAPTTPWWAWLFIPDCPLFGLLGGLGLLMVTAQNHWTTAAQVRGQRWLATVAVASLVVWLSTYLPNTLFFEVTSGWRQQSALFAVWSWSLLLVAIFFRRPPAWLLGLFAFGQIKYGIWTISAWLLYWQNTAAAFGAPHFSFDSVFMTLTHIGLVAQGIFLLTYFRPTPAAALAALLWFGASDFVDYGLGFYPSIPEQFIPLPVMQWSTITVTLLLSGFYLLLGLTRPAQARAIRG